ncbi:MAG: hypothetical protein HQL11_03115 [Candidatus Omnitrophica bacterium]|nr:hypothetical protein [Candidatus Omnitrophota bacterium]
MKKNRAEEEPQKTDDRAELPGTPRGIILERFKRMKALPTHSLDTFSEFFAHHYLRNKRFLI